MDRTSAAKERFRNMRLVEEYDTQDPKDHDLVALPLLMKRTKVIDIVAARGIIFALAQSGVCASFSRETNKRICFLNVSPDEVIRSLFYNKKNDSLITVSVDGSDNFSSFKCRSTSIKYILEGQAEAGFALFESESLKWPGFVEFDDVNEKDHHHSHPFYITSDQELIISYCKADTEEDQSIEGNLGSINIRNILTGNCLAQIKASDDHPKEEDCSSGLGNSKQRKNVVAEAMKNVMKYTQETYTALSMSGLTESTHHFFA